MPTAFRYQDPKNKREQLTVTIDGRKAAELKPKKLNELHWLHGVGGFFAVFGGVASPAARSYLRSLAVASPETPVRPAGGPVQVWRKRVPETAG
jgi:hypothetical protein